MDFQKQYNQVQLFDQFRKSVVSYFTDLVREVAKKYGRDVGYYEAKNSMDKAFVRWWFYTNSQGLIENFVPIKFEPQIEDVLYFLNCRGIPLDVKHSGYNQDVIELSLQEYISKSDTVPHKFRKIYPVAKVIGDMVEISVMTGTRELDKRVMSLVQFERLKKLFSLKDKFLEYATIELYRLTSLGSLNEHLSVPPRILGYLGIQVELFGTPLNTSLSEYCSPFPDIETFFGSKGSFLEYKLDTGRMYSFNPPYDNELMYLASLRLVSMLKEVPNVHVFCILPVRDPEAQKSIGFSTHNEPFKAYSVLKESGYIIEERAVLKEDYPYYNYFTNSYINVTNTHIILISNTGTLPEHWAIDGILGLWKESAQC